MQIKLFALVFLTTLILTSVAVDAKSNSFAYTSVKKIIAPRKNAYAPSAQTTSISDNKRPEYGSVCRQGKLSTYCKFEKKYGNVDNSALRSSWQENVLKMRLR